MRIELRKEFSPGELAAIRRLFCAAKFWDMEATDEAVAAALAGSFAVAAAFDESGEPVGVARAVSDGVSDAYIQDVTVAAPQRRKGIGGELVKALVRALRSSGIDWIALVGVPGSEEFYSSLGFTAQPGHTLFVFKD